jgi:ABC-type oligopeptide transport system substrate-binding subunit
MGNARFAPRARGGALTARACPGWIARSRCAGWTRDCADPQTVLDPTLARYNLVPSANSDFGQVDDPQINTAMKAAGQVAKPNARAAAWGRIDRMLVDIAAAIPWAFLGNPTIESPDVRGISTCRNAGFSDYSCTSAR